MNPVSWAKKILRPILEESSEGGPSLTKALQREAGAKCPSCEVPEHFQDEGVQWWHFTVLRKDAERACKDKGSRVSAAIRKDSGATTAERIHTPRRHLSLKDVRDVLLECREQIRYYQEKAAKLLRWAVEERHYKQLRLEFTEFWKKGAK